MDTGSGESAITVLGAVRSEEGCESEAADAGEMMGMQVRMQLPGDKARHKGNLRNQDEVYHLIFKAFMNPLRIHQTSVSFKLCLFLM